jgi:hypothetical protein
MMRELSPNGFCALRDSIAKENNMKLAEGLLQYLAQKESMLQKNFDQWKNAMHHNKESIESIKWMPVTVSKKQGLSAIRYTRPKEETDIVATVMPICNVEIPSPTLKKLLLWDTPPAVSLVVKHLANLSKQFAQMASNNEEREKIVVIGERVTEMTTKVYQFIDTFLGDPNNQETSKQQVIKELKSFHSIWIGDRFVGVAQLALSSSSRMLNLAPYLYEVPVQLRHYEKLLTSLEIKEQFDSSDFLKVLNHLNDVHSKVPFSVQENNIKLAVLILQAIYKDTKTISQQNIIVPTQNNKFAVAENLIYVDSKELFEKIHNTMDDYAPLLIHPELSNEVARNLGAKSLTRYIEETSSELLTDDFGEAFGQRERLTQRIGNILKDYPATEATVFKEMLQNAEDAGASEFAVVFDKRSFGKQTLVNESLSAFQGPSLLIYNNSIFTDDDIRGIQQLGVPNKLASLSKIGRFAIGFNSVYHFTDLPSFVSLDKLILLDAHAKYVRGATSSHPGRLYRFTNRGFVESFEDQVSCYRAMGCSMNSQPFNGTLFRLPLRTKQQASASEISKQSWDSDSVMSQLETFISEARDCLLFLRNVKRISVYIQHADDNNALEKLLDIQAAKSEPIRQMENDLKKCIEQLEEIADQVPSNTHGRSKKKKQQQSMFNRIFSGVSGIITGTFGTTAQKRLGTMEISINVKDEQTKEMKVSHETWVLSGCVGGNDAYDLAVQNVRRSDRKYRLVPHAAVAVRLDDFRTATDVPALEGRAFSFLPLPIETGLNVHMNSFFELGTSRRDLWQSKLGEKRNESHFDIRDKWNRVLLENCVVPALLNLIDWLNKSNIESNRPRSEKQKIFYRIMELAPQRNKIGTNPLMNTLLSPFYWSLASYQSFYSQSFPNAFLSLNGIYLDSPQGQTEKKEKERKGKGKQHNVQQLTTRVARSQLHDMLINDGFPLVIVPNSVIDGMKEVLEHMEFVTPRNVRKFYKNFFANEMNQRALRERAAEDGERIRKLKRIEQQKMKLQQHQQEQQKEIEHEGESLQTDSQDNNDQQPKPEIEVVPEPVQKPIVITIIADRQTVREYINQLWDFCLRTTDDIDASDFTDFPIPMISGTVMFVSPRDKMTYKKKNSRKGSSWFSNESFHKSEVYYTDKETLILNLIPWKAADFIDVGFVQQFSSIVPKMSRDDEHSFWTELGITHLTPALFYDFLCQHMPQRLILTQRATSTSYTPNSTVQPTTEWLVDMWKYLDEHFDDKNRDLFAHLALVPTMDRRLFRICSGTEVINTHEHPASMADILTILQVPVALPTFTTQFKTIRTVTSPLNDNTLIDALHKIPHDRFEQLSNDQKTVLLQFFNVRNMSREEVEWLGSLPLFELTSGEYVSVNRFREGHHHSRIFSESKKCRLPHYPSSIKILKKQSRSLNILYRELGIKKALDLNLYRDFILGGQAFTRLTANEQALHMNHILSVPELREHLKQKLAELPFLNGRKPSECYDPENECFKLFIADPDAFPASPYNSEEWIKFLKKDLGLISAVTKEFLLSCRIDDSDVNIARYKATVLLAQLYDRQKGLVFDNTVFLKDIASMNILPVKDLSESYIGNKNQKFLSTAKSNGLQSISRCVNPQYTDIVFTAAYIYDEEYEDVVEAICHRIQQPVTPKPAYVMEHLINMSSMKQHDIEMLNNAHDIDYVRRTCVEIYRYLAKQPLKPNIAPSSDQQPKLIYVDGYFLYPQTLFLKIDENYAPYIYRVPDDYFEFTKLFIHWGVKEKPTDDFCYRILKQMRMKAKECDEGILSPTDVELCLRLIRLLVTEHASTLSGSFLVTTKQTLAPHRSVLVDDAPYLHARIETKEFDFLHPDLIDLAQKLGLKMLSAVINEHLKTVSRETPVHQTDATIKMTNALHQPQFTSCLMRLLRHANGSEAVVPLEKIAELKTFTCLEVDVLNCAYVDSRDGRDITRGDYESGSHCVLDPKDAKIFISRRIPSYLDPYVVVSRSINQHLGYTSQDATVLSLMLKCVYGDQMERILDDFNITSVSGGDTNLNRKVGERVFEEDLKHFIPANEDTNFTMGEMIAFEDTNSVTREVTLRYGRISKRLDHHHYVIERAPHVAVTLNSQVMRKFVLSTDEEKSEEELLHSSAPQPTNTKIVHETLSSALICPITQEIFREPVILSDGNTYEKSAILQWLQTRDTSPLTRERLSSKVLIPNYMIQSLIREYIDCD